MPELPEVQTVAQSLIDGQGLAKGIVGRTVARAQVECAKYIRIDLSEDTLLVHLRMSGDLLLGEQEQPLGKFSRAQIYFEDGVQMSFDDARKFGRLWLVADPESIFADLGPEPLDDSIQPAAFHEMLTSRNRQLKPLLLDQSFIAGLGNIYVDEALHAAQLHPLAASSSLARAKSAARQHQRQRGQHRLGLPRRRVPEQIQCLPENRRALPPLWHPDRTHRRRPTGDAHLSQLSEAVISE